MEHTEAETVEGYLGNALEHAENEETKYWIRTALQHLVADRDPPEQPAP